MGRRRESWRKIFCRFSTQNHPRKSISCHELASWADGICASKRCKLDRMPWCNNWQIFDLILVLGTISLSGNGLQAAFLDAVRTGRRPLSIRGHKLQLRWN